MLFFYFPLSFFCGATTRRTPFSHTLSFLTGQQNNLSKLSHKNTPFFLSISQRRPGRPRLAVDGAHAHPRDAVLAHARFEGQRLCVWKVGWVSLRQRKRKRSTHHTPFPSLTGGTLTTTCSPSSRHASHSAGTPLGVDGPHGTGVNARPVYSTGAASAAINETCAQNPGSASLASKSARTASGRWRVGSWSSVKRRPACVATVRGGGGACGSTRRALRAPTATWGAACTP